MTTSDSSLPFPKERRPIPARDQLSRTLSRRSLVAGAVVIGVGAAGVAMPLRTQGRILPGVKVEGVDLTDMTRSEADITLREIFAPLEARAITFRFGDQTWDASLADLGIEIDYTAIENAAWNHGRDGNIIHRYAAMADQIDPLDIKLIFTRDEAGLEHFLDVIARTTDQEPRNAILVRRSGELDIVKDVQGAKLDRAKAKQEVDASLLKATPGEVTVTTLPVTAEVTADALAGAKEDAAMLVSAPITIRYEDQSWEIPVDDLMAALRIPRNEPANLNLETLQPTLDAIAAEVLIEPVPVMLGWDGGLNVLAPDEDGQQVDMAKLTSDVLAAAKSTDREIEAPMVVLRADAREDNVSELGITGLISRGQSAFYGSAEERKINIRVCAEHVSNHVIAPGGQFSFNQAIGPISLENGYVEGKVIRGDWTASDLGGGACQVSTTVFRAAFYAGLKFDERWAHGWRLASYELLGEQPGLEAAIYQPNTEWEMEKDLIFTNPFDTWILLQAFTDGDELQVQLFSSELDYTIEVPDSEVSDPIDPGEPVYAANPDLSPGQVEQVGKAQDGYYVLVTRNFVDGDGNVFDTDQFESKYRSRPDSFEVAPNDPRINSTPAA